MPRRLDLHRSYNRAASLAPTGLVSFQQFPNLFFICLWKKKKFTENLVSCFNFEVEFVFSVDNLFLSFVYYLEISV